jgi:tRNA nucleotidyltransferase/poly(A) polymerase
MPDYVYLLENRLSRDQQHALRLIRDAALEAQLNLFLAGAAVRDLTSGSQVRELEVVIQGNALKLKKKLEKGGAKTWAEDPVSRTLFLCFPGTTRVDVTSACRIDYPAPGKPVYHWSSMQDALRHRDFTANSMAISLNEGSYGLLMDPLNGVADIENRSLRLASNTGFLDEPAYLIRATRLLERLGWMLDERTQTRYNNAKEEDIIKYLSPFMRSLETEAIFHEEDGPRALSALEREGWMKNLFPALTSAKLDQTRLTALHELLVRLQVVGIHPDISAIQAELMTAKLAPRESAALKKQLLRTGFVEEWKSLDDMAKNFQKVLLAKENASPSATWKLFHSYDPEAVLWLGFTSKNAQVQERYTNFLNVWPEFRQKAPHTLMYEMRITTELPVYKELIEEIFLAMLDGKLLEEAELKAFLEPHSPPAPPPPVTLKRSRATKKSAEVRAKAKAAEDSLDGEDEDGTLHDEIEGLDDDVEVVDLDEVEGEEEEDVRPITPKKGAKAAPAAKTAPVTRPAAKAPAAKPAVTVKVVQAKVTPVVAKTSSAKTAAKPATKPAPKPAAKPAPKPVAKKAAPVKKPKVVVKKPIVVAKKQVKKPVLVVKKPTPKPVARKPVPKPVAKKVVKPTAKKTAKPVAKKPVAKKIAKPIAKKHSGKKR